MDITTSALLHCEIWTNTTGNNEAHYLPNEKGRIPQCDTFDPEAGPVEYGTGTRRIAGPPFTTSCPGVPSSGCAYRQTAKCAGIQHVVPRTADFMAENSPALTKPAHMTLHASLRILEL